jgi:hypothetical protein
MNKKARIKNWPFCRLFYLLRLEHHANKIILNWINGYKKGKMPFWYNEHVVFNFR